MLRLLRTVLSFYLAQSVSCSPEGNRFSACECNVMVIVCCGNRLAIPVKRQVYRHDTP